MRIPNTRAYNNQKETTCRVRTYKTRTVQWWAAIKP